MTKKDYIKYLLVLSLLYLISANSAHADIYFNAKIAGPITDVSAINDDGKYYKITSGKSQQDKNFSIATSNVIAFASNRPQSEGQRVQQTMNIFLRENSNNDPSEEVLTQLSQSDHFSFSPQFSPDKKTLAYISQSQDKINHLYLYDLDTKTQKILFSAPQIVDYMWSNDSQTLLYSYADTEISSIKVYSLPSKEEETLLSHSIKALEKNAVKNDLTNTENNKRAYLVTATWSPDETKIAFIHHPLSTSESKSLKVYDVSTKEVTTLSQEKHQVQAPLDWRNDSKALLYSALVDFKTYYDNNLRDKVYEGALHIFTSEIDGTTSQLTQGNHYHGHPTYSPNDKKIAYLYAKKLGDQLTYRLRTMSNSGSNDQEIYADVYRESSLVWR